MELRRTDDQQQGAQSPSLQRDQQVPTEKVAMDGGAKASAAADDSAATITPGREGQPATVTFTPGVDSTNSSVTADSSVNRESFQNQLTKAMDIFSLG